MSVVFAIDCDNLPTVFGALKGKYKSKQFINCADNDHAKGENAGIKQANYGQFLWPIFNNFYGQFLTIFMANF